MIVRHKKKSLLKRLLFFISHPGIYLGKMLYHYQLFIDRIKGVDFHKIEQAPDLNLTNAEFVGYWPSDNQYLLNVLASLTITTNDAVLDVGCGKGAAMAKFISRGFTQVDGIEFTAQLSEVARKNMKVLDLRCVIYQGDAQTFDGYYRYNYFYFYNPFTGSVMESVIKRIEESLIHEPRKVTIIYKNAVCDDLIRKNGVFIKRHVFSNQKGEQPFIVYTNDYP
jgi:SAM-dependent methyltransferase